MACGHSSRANILKCEVKWALGSITTSKASGGDRIPAELFQILKDNTVSAFNMSANLENPSLAIGLEKVSFHSNLKEGTMPKSVPTTAQLRSFHMLPK